MMSGMIGVLIFAAVSAFSAVVACNVNGFLTGPIAAGSLLAGVLTGGWAGWSCRGLFRGSLKLSWFDKLMFFFFGLLCLRQFLWIYFYKGGSVCTLNGRHNFSDLCEHLTFIANFVQGLRFWPDDPRVAGHPLHYYFGMDLFNALLDKTGVPLTHALPLTGLVFGIVTLLALHLWGRGFVIGAFLFSGGFAGYWVFITHRFDDYQAELAWKSLPLTLMIPQRGYLYAFPAGLLLLWSWKRRFMDGEKPLPVWIEGILWGVMPLFHSVTFGFLALIFFIWSVACRRTREALPVYYAAVLPAAYLTLKLTSNFQVLTSLMGFKPGWEIGAENPILFFLINFGFYFPLAFCALFLAAQARDRHGLLLAVPALVVFIVLMFVSIFPAPWDNIKVLVWCYLLMLPVIDRYTIRPLAWYIRVPLLTMLFLSGFVCVFGSMGRAHQPGCFIEREEQDGVCHAVRNLPHAERFASAADFNHPLLLCGRQIVVGWNGHLWSQGIPPRPLEEKLGRLMTGEFDWRQNAQALGARYLFWGPREERLFASSNRPWEALCPLVASGRWGKIYDLRADSDRLKKGRFHASAPAGQGLRVLYFAGRDYSGAPVKEEYWLDVNREWNQPAMPVPQPFSAVIEGELDMPENGESVFYLSSDDGAVLEIDSRVVLDNGGSHPERVRKSTVALTRGRHGFRIRYFDTGGQAVLRCWWVLPSGKEETIPSESLRAPQA